MPCQESNPGNRAILIPKPLAPGDTIGIIAASGPPEPEVLLKGLEFLREKGFRTLLGCHVYERDGYLAGSDDQRCGDLNSMLGDPEVQAVIFARGGYGVMRLLESIDRVSVIKSPKLMVGMSDVTAIQLSLFTLSGLATLSGPMIAGQVGEGLDPLSERSLIEALTQTPSGRDLFLPVAGSLKILRHGQAEGHLLGGCLSLVAALLGTSHSPDYTGAILLLEDVHEPAYRIDRMLTQLKLAGILGNLSALILGHFIGPGNEDLQGEAERIVLELTADRPVPVISGFPHGHKLPNLTVPHGVLADLDSHAPSLVVRSVLTPEIGVG